MFISIPLTIQNLVCSRSEIVYIHSVFTIQINGAYISGEHIQYEIKDSVAIIKFDSPGVKV